MTGCVFPALSKRSSRSLSLTLTLSLLLLLFKSADVAARASRTRHAALVGPGAAGISSRNCVHSRAAANQCVGLGRPAVVGKRRQNLSKRDSGPRHDVAPTIWKADPAQSTALLCQNSSSVHDTRRLTDLAVSYMIPLSERTPDCDGHERAHRGPALAIRSIAQIVDAPRKRQV